MGVIYINPEHDVLLLDQPWDEAHLTAGPREPPDTRKEFTLLAKPLRRQAQRDRIRNVLEFPAVPADMPDKFDIEDSEGESCYYYLEDVPEVQQWGFADDDWNFDGVTKRLTLNDPLDVGQSWNFYQDAKEMTGSDFLEKWGGFFTRS